MAFKAEQCKATTKSGKRCKQPAMAGDEYCRFHAQTPTNGEEDAPATPEQPTEAQGKGAQPGNQNARKHGGYGLQLLPEEEPLYREKLEQFSAQLGDVDIFDSQVVHILSLISTKLDVAAGEGAPAQVLIPISNEVLRLLRSLKETRDSRDREEAHAPKSFADFLEELAAIEEERGIPQNREDERKRIYELEQEVNSLRKQLQLPPREDIEHKTDHCGHCRGETEHRKNVHGDWVCLNCGCVQGAPTDSAGGK